ncbi:methyltransferase domain-containing protein [Myxococcota bacterium]|nr:methyltransferase domain-containing protein [Myxococcota bacterium]
MRLLALLDRHPLSVGELAAVTQLAQPRVSTHLGRLRDAGLVLAHREGQGSLYRPAEEDWSPAQAAVVRAVLAAADDPLLHQDAARAEAVLAARQDAGTWADAVAGQMARHYSPGRTWEAVARGLVGLSRLGRVVDIASGDGAVAELLAPHAASVTCVDISPRVVALAQARLVGVAGLSVTQGDMHALPFPDASFDHALMLASLSYSDRPALALAEAARVLVPGGRLVAVTLHAHGHRAEVARYDHKNLGFTPEALAGLATAAGLRPHLCAVTGRERRPPQHQVLTLHATKPDPA